MSDGIKNFAEALRQECVDKGALVEDANSTNLSLNKQEFMEKMLKEKDGEALLLLLEDGEWKVAERLGLINGRLENGQPRFDVPRWNNLVQHLKIVHSV